MTSVATTSADDRAPGESARGRWLPLVVLISTFAVFGVLSVACWLMYDQTEHRLLEERTGVASQVLTVSVIGIQGPLSSAASSAAVTDGDPAALERDFRDRIGPDQSFDAAVLFRVGSDEPVASIGEPVDFAASGPGSAQAIVEEALAAPFAGINLLDDGRRLGYAVADDLESPTFVVYAENRLDPNPNVRRQQNEAFATLDYAIYLNEESPENLLGSSVPNDDLPIGGRRESALSPFGDEQLLLVMSPIGQMSSWLFANLWWIVALLGIALGVGAAWLTRNLYHRREEAFALADDNARLYDEQRHIAETLQLSLLPQELIAPPGGAVAARYWPAGEASLIGGDFYDAFQVDHRRWAVVIGDVCGKGIDAAAITGLARHTLRAAAHNSDSPSEVLHEVHRALLEHQPSTFCTVCFFYVTVASDGSQSLMIALGGHPGPLLRHVDGRVEEIGVPGSLLGLFPPTLVDSTVVVEPGDTIVLYTDGLTDAPHDQAVPLDELIELIAAEGDEPVALLADSIRPLKRRRRPHGSADDTAIVVLRVGVSPSAPGAAVGRDADTAQSASV